MAAAKAYLDEQERAMDSDMHFHQSIEPKEMETVSFRRGNPTNSIVHEFVHLLTLQVNPTLRITPRWLGKRWLSINLQIIGSMNNRNAIKSPVLMACSRAALTTPMVVQQSMKSVGYTIGGAD
ncbi:hypothetical protein OH492_12200 [Vibrio chagasii]|nr:hypothetical protein [Vibrio chagasii]